MPKNTPTESIIMPTIRSIFPPVMALAIALLIYSSTVYAQQKTGSGQLEPGLADRDDILFSTDFESDDWLKPWDSVNHRKNLRLVDPTDVDGIPAFEGRALEVTINKGDFYGAGPQFTFEKHLGRRPNEMYARYYCCFAEDWHGYGGKGPGWCGTEKAGWGGKPSDGYNGWSARAGLKSNSNGTLAMYYYTYHALMRGIYGDGFYWSGDGAQLQPNRWYCIEQYCKINTPGESDGILRAWVDGKLVLDKTDVQMRKTDRIGLKSYWMNYYHGGKDRSVKDRHVYLDNLVLATDERIGLITGAEVNEPEAESSPE